MFSLVESREDIRSFEIDILHRTKDPGSIRVPKVRTTFPVLVAGILTHEWTPGYVRDRINRKAEGKGTQMIPTLNLVLIDHTKAKKLVHYRTLTRLRRRLAKIVTTPDEFEEVVSHIKRTSPLVRKGSRTASPKSVELFDKVARRTLFDINVHYGYPVILISATASNVDKYGVPCVYPILAYATLKQAKALAYYKKNSKGKSPSAPPSDYTTQILSDNLIGKYVESTCISETMNQQILTRYPRRRGRGVPW